MAAVISGWSPERTTTSADSPISSIAARIAPPVPFASGWTTVSVSPGRPGVRSWVGETITTIRPAPASRAARTGQAIMGLPHTGCRTLGIEERMRVPSPAAMIRTVGACSAAATGES